jgi:hypothetical protein
MNAGWRLAVALGIGYFPVMSTAQVNVLDKATEGYAIFEIRYDESYGKRPSPVIPKGWRFVGVSNGQKMNSNNLWFQDQAGNIYVVRGFNTDSKFVLEDNAHKLSSSK